MSYSVYCSGTRQWGGESETAKGANYEQLSVEERFNQMLLQADELVQRQDYEEAVIKLRLLAEKINLQKQSRKDYDRKLELVCLYNLAAAYQKQWNLDECIPLLEKFIALLRSCLQENLKASGSLADPPNKHWFKMKTMLIKSLLQHCAVLSQIGEHKRALKIAIDLTGELKQLFRRGYDECVKTIARKQSGMQKKSSYKTFLQPKVHEGKSGNDKIEFSFSVLLSARDMLQELVKMQTYQDITDNSYPQIQAEMQEVKSKIYFWKSNPENNIKMLRQSFSNPPEEEQGKKGERNLLGIKRNKSWLEEFTIAKIMFMTPLNYLEFSDSDNLIFEFNHRNIIEKVILLSVTYFSLSIQLRFLEDDHLERRKSKPAADPKKVPEQLQKSQIFHLKSIEVVCKHIKQNSAFVTHLVVNYHKHYKNNLNIIEQENSLAEYSELYDARRHSKTNSCQQMIIPNDNNGNTLKEPPITGYRKDSVYYTQEEEEITLPETHKPREKEQREVRDTRDVREVREVKDVKDQKEKEIKQKEEETVFSFKKMNKKKIHQQEDKSQRSRKLGNSTSFSKFEVEAVSQKDKTMKKVSQSKMITVVKADIRLLSDRSDKEISSSKQFSMKSIDKKSLSKSKNFLKNSITLKQNKSHSPTKDRSKAKQLKDLKQSTDLSKRDFGKKKSPQPSRALDLLKKSGSLQELQLKNSKQITTTNIYTSPNTLHLKKKR